MFWKFFSTLCLYKLNSICGNSSLLRNELILEWPRITQFKCLLGISAKVLKAKLVLKFLLILSKLAES